MLHYSPHFSGLSQASNITASLATPVLAVNTMRIITIFKSVIQLTLLTIFSYFFGFPQLLKYLENQVLVTLSQHEEGSIAAPAVTICGRNPSTKAWLNHGGFDVVLKECNASKNFFTCAESKTWTFEDIIIGAQKGYVLKKSLTNTSIWRRENFNNWICYTLDVGGNIGSDTTTDELYIFLNLTMDYIFYIHSNIYYVQNYVPSLIPINRFKVFSDACSSYFQLTLTEKVEINTAEDPCHPWLK